MFCRFLEIYLDYRLLLHISLEQVGLFRRGTSLSCLRVFTRQSVVAAACLAGVAPYGAAGLDFMAGMGEDNVAEFSSSSSSPQNLNDLPIHFTFHNRFGG